MNWEQLDVLRRQLEDDFRLDTEAIERLQRRFHSNAGSSPAAWPTYMSTPAGDASPAEVPAVEPRPEHAAQSDELTGTLRAMFNGSARR